jgi:hypothetical protein
VRNSLRAARCRGREQNDEREGRLQGCQRFVGTGRAGVDDAAGAGRA